MTERTPLVALSLEEIEAAITILGYPAFRARQIHDWLYTKSAQSYDAMSNVPKALREELTRLHPFGSPRLLSEQISHDKSRKFLLSFEDDFAIECVALFDKNRLTACISSQAGCPAGCLFCATGAAGFTTNLTPWQITEQVRYISFACKKRVSNVVFMGQGEPFFNTDAVFNALKKLNSSNYFGIGARKITVSTCGVPSGIEKFSRLQEQFGLAISLHSANQTIRDTLMPGVSSYPLTELKKSLKRYQALTGRRITLEYLLIKDVNDSQKDAEELVAFCDSLKVYVNVLQLHETPASSLRPASYAAEKTFLSTLQHAGIESARRVSRGEDIDAACGQLAQKEINKL